MATSVSDLNHLVLIHAPDAPDVVIERLLIETMRDFCMQTRIWKEELADAAISLNILFIDIGTGGQALLPTDSELIDVVSAKLTSASMPMGRRTWRQLDSEIGTDWRTATAAEPRYIGLHTDVNKLTIAPNPTAETDLELAVTLMPSLGATTLDDQLISEYRDCFVHGVLSRLLRVPNQTWTQPEIAVAYQQEFETKIRETRFKSNLGMRLN